MARDTTRIKRKSRSVPPKPETLPPCRVCDAKASGLHYGVYSCHGCKGFFRRSQSRKLLYKCKGGKHTCALNRKSQRSCAFCRYEKCLALGMSRDSIRTGRYTYSMRADNLNEINILSSVLENNSSKTDRRNGTDEETDAHRVSYGESNSNHLFYEKYIYQNRKYEHDKSIREKHVDHIDENSSASVVVSDRQSLEDVLGTGEQYCYRYSEDNSLRSYSDTLSNSSTSSNDSSFLCNAYGRAFLFSPSIDERRRNNSFDSGASLDKSPITGTYSESTILSEKEQVPEPYQTLPMCQENSSGFLEYSDHTAYTTYNQSIMETYSNYHNPLTSIDHNRYQESNYIMARSSGLQPNMTDPSSLHHVDSQSSDFDIQDGKKVNNNPRPVVDQYNYSETLHCPLHANQEIHSEYLCADGSTVRPITTDNRRKSFEIVQHMWQSNQRAIQLPSSEGPGLSASNGMCLDSTIIAKLDSVNNQNDYYGTNLQKKEPDEQSMSVSQIIHENNILADFQFDASPECKQLEGKYMTAELTQSDANYSNDAMCNTVLTEACQLKAAPSLVVDFASGMNTKATGDIKLGHNDYDSDSIPDLVCASSVQKRSGIGELGESEMNSVSEIVTVAQTKYNIVGQLLKNEEELRNQQREYYEQQKLKDSLFGDLKALSRDEFNAFYKATGIDLDNRFQFADKVLHIYEREVVKYIRFSKCVPGFSELPVADQSVMLKGSVFESGFLESYRTYNYELGVTTFPEGSCFRLKDICYLDNHEYGLLKLEFAKQLRELDVGTTEIAFLKAIILLFTDRFPLESPAEAEMLQVKMIRCFRHYLSRTRHEEADKRFFTLWNRVIAVRNLAELNIKLRQHTIIDFPKVQQFPLSYQLVYGQ